MTNYRTLRTAALSFTAIAALTLSTLGYAQTAPQSATKAKPETKAEEAAEARQSISDPESSVPHKWTTDQILTATVHQAWVLSGQDDTAFFEIVKELAEISAHNRNLNLPDSPVAGRRAGAYIKAQAKLDHNQLLYDIVDKSVRMTGTKATTTTASK